MHEDRLPVASVAAVAGVLRHVRVHDEAVRRRIAEAQGFVGLNLTKEPPTARGTRHILVDRTCDVRDDCTAARTRRQLARRHILRITDRLPANIKQAPATTTEPPGWSG